MADRLDLDRLAELDAEATEGPWGWKGHRSRGGMFLGALHSGFLDVMDFVRQGMNGAQPRFQVDHLMTKAEDLAVLEVTYRDAIKDIDHPDARIIYEARNALPALLTAARCAQEALPYLRMLGEFEHPEVQLAGARPLNEIVADLKAVLPSPPEVAP